MIKISDIERSYMQRDSRTFYARILCNDREVSGIVRSMKYNKGSCGSTSFMPQSIFSGFADISIDYCERDLIGKKITVQNGIKIGGTDYWHTVGTYYVNKAPVKGNRTTIEALGVISAKLGKKYTGGACSTVSELLAKLEDIAGCSITLEDGMEDLTLPDNDLSDYYCREVLGLVAGLYFGYATETVDGNIVIKTYDAYTEDIITAYPSRMASDPEIYEEARVQGIQVIGSGDAEILVGDLQNCSLTNPLVTPETLTDYALNYIGFTYEPYEMEMTLGDFTIEPWDLIQITDREGVAHTLRPMSIKHTFDGGLKTVISAPTLDSGEDLSREETTMQSNTAYNALVSGNFGINSGGVEPGGGGSSGGGNFAVEIFDIQGSDVTSGIGWIDNGGGQAFACINFKIPAVSTRSGTINGNLSFDTIRDLLPYKRTTNTISTYITIPIFAYGSSYYSAGGLSVVATISPSLCQYSLDYSWTNNYMQEELGQLFTYNSETGQYDILVNDVEFQAHFFWILNSVATN